MSLLLTLAPMPAFAGLSSGSGGPWVVVAVPEPRTVAVFMAMPADSVSVPIRVVSEQKDAALAYEETRQTIDLISQRAKENGQFRAATGVVSLTERRSGFGISSGSWRQPAAKAELYLIVPLTQGRDNIFAAGAEAARFVQGLRLPGKARCELGDMRLAVENPEQYRAKLLGQIADEIRKTREAMGAQGNFRVEGLESSVMVRQADDRQVELFLNYSLAITTEK